MSYTMKDLIEKEIAVSFKNKKEMRSFLEKCQKANLRWNKGKKATEFTPPEWFDCISYGFKTVNTLLGYARKEFYEDWGYKIVPFSEFDFDKSTKKIYITVEENKVHAILKENGKVINRSVATCSDEDEFNFETGAKIAFNRLFEVSDKSTYKIGDTVKVISRGHAYT